MDGNDAWMAGSSSSSEGEEDCESHLSRMETHWANVILAHSDQTAESREALETLLKRYGGAVHRYLLKSIRHHHDVDELSQEFALKLSRRDFRNADPASGRFRDYLKQALYHLMMDYHRKRRSHTRLPATGRTPPDDIDLWSREYDRAFLSCWRDGLLKRAWDSLAEQQERTGQPFYDVLKLKTDTSNRKLTSRQIAEILTVRLNKLATENWVNVNALRARDMFVEFFIEEVAATLREPTHECLEEELERLGLLHRCRPALRRRRNATRESNPKRDKKRDD